MLTKKVAAQLAASVFLALPAAALAQGTKETTLPVERLIERYTELAGSHSNAVSLVNGLRTGGSITLAYESATVSPTGPTEEIIWGPMGPIVVIVEPAPSEPTPSEVTFTPPTGTLGSTVNHALSLAEAHLAKLGISSPNPLQLRAVLIGGTVPNGNGGTDVYGILNMRAEGAGWGDIAHSLGLQIGSLARTAR